MTNMNIKDENYVVQLPISCHNASQDFHMANSIPFSYTDAHIMGEAKIKKMKCFHDFIQQTNHLGIKYMPYMVKLLCQVERNYHHAR
jgi:hypothetical protein